VPVAAGEGFSREQRERLARAQSAAEAQTGIRISVRIGEIDGDPALVAERLLANIVSTPHDPGVLILVSPGQRVVQILTTPGAKRRISDQAAGLAVLGMTSSFAVGDLVGGIVNGLRQLSDAAGAPASGNVRPVVPAERAAVG
jgi:uncharacterized membrane protein YgcG